MGVKGDQGDIGVQGPKGNAGEEGRQGLEGAKGNMGQKGAVGDKGGRGDVGRKGDMGEEGRQGVKGEKGEQGFPGLRGATGHPGVQGPQGEKGDFGRDGLPGKKGESGSSVLHTCGGGSSRAPTEKERSSFTPGQQVGAITTKAGAETANASPANPPTSLLVPSVRMLATSTAPSSRCGGTFRRQIYSYRTRMSLALCATSSLAGPLS